MPTIEQNRSLWSDYHWKDLGEEWSSAWGGSEFQWQWSILPRIRAFLPASTILEIASGCGRWTQYLKHYCNNLIGVDLSESCVEVCRSRFSADRQMAFHVNNGRSLSMVPDGSVDFAFSFDSLVHAEAEVLESYMAQLAKKLAPDGIGFIHHSNLGSYPYYYSMRNMVPKVGRLLTKVGLADNDGMRTLDMTADLFVTFAERTGLRCTSQEIINWSSRRLIDCISTFTLPGSRWMRPNVVVRNPLFMKEASYIRKLSPLYLPADIAVLPGPLPQSQ